MVVRWLEMNDICLCALWSICPHAIRWSVLTEIHTNAHRTYEYVICGAMRLPSTNSKQSNRKRHANCVHGKWKSIEHVKQKHNWDLLLQGISGRSWTLGTMADTSSKSARDHRTPWRTNRNKFRSMRTPHTYDAHVTHQVQWPHRRYQVYGLAGIDFIYWYLGLNWKVSKCYRIPLNSNSTRSLFFSLSTIDKNVFVHFDSNEFADIDSIIPRFRYEV